MSSVYCRSIEAMDLHTAEPESLEDYFQKGAVLGQKATLNVWYVDTRPNSQTVPEHLKVNHIWLINKKKKYVYLYFLFT